MKLYIVTLVCFMLTSFSSLAQKNIQATFEVKGVCGMCKKRIEKAALVPGVKMATWDQKSGQMKVYFRSDKVTELDIHKSIANVGHTTSKVKAPAEAYSKLPACCAYDSGVNKH
ncbi:heavy-metal-associated domain-containing protein [Reichenbachiella versicolor]|uniref:heavy-metal-associated domain-containing protein n=1 Tax=Reichenbachiella versicolor TaxID=1821036 RepID=UPI001C870DB2|nr:heavy-metal-associated domain-containing protein [Reichenbachiella versicolor]